MAEGAMQQVLAHVPKLFAEFQARNRLDQGDCEAIVEKARHLANLKEQQPAKDSACQQSAETQSHEDTSAASPSASQLTDASSEKTAEGDGVLIFPVSESGDTHEDSELSRLAKDLGVLRLAKEVKSLRQEVDLLTARLEEAGV